MDVDATLKYQWLQLYTPYMESIMAGNGTQYVRLVLDYENMERVADAPQDSQEDDAQQSMREQYQDSYALLAESIKQANSYIAQTDTYTAASIKSLTALRDKAQELYAAGQADGTEASTMASELALAIVKMERKSSSQAASGTGTASTSTGSSKSKKSSAVLAKQLKASKLANGTYTLYATVVKIDKQTLSMADKSVSHTVRLTVSGSSYKLTLTLGSVEVNGQSSYLSKMRYFKNSYTEDAYGRPMGKSAAASIVSYQENAKGKRIKDAYGTDYPAKLRIPFIKKARKSGYVPVQVYVPIMEAIAAGNGTQQAYIKLDLASIVAGSKTAKSSSSKGASASSGTKTKASGSGSATSAGSSAGSASSASGTTLTGGSGLLGAESSDAQGLGAGLGLGTGLDSGADAGYAALNEAAPGLGAGEMAASGNADAPVLEEIDDAQVVLDSDTAPGASANAGGSAAAGADGAGLGAVAQVASAAIAKQPPLRGKELGLVAVPVGIAALCVAYSAFKRRNRAFR